MRFSKSILFTAALAFSSFAAHAVELTNKDVAAVAPSKKTVALAVFNHDGSFGITPPGQASRILFTVYNPSSVKVSGVKVSVSGDRASEVTLTNSCPETLAPRQKCDVGAEWAPVSEGSLNAELMVSAASLGASVPSGLQGMSR